MLHHKIETFLIKFTSKDVLWREELPFEDNMRDATLFTPPRILVAAGHAACYFYVSAFASLFSLSFIPKNHRIIFDNVLAVNIFNKF